MNDLSLKDSALEYAEKGFIVAPLWPKSKIPLMGFESTEPSYDPQMIDYWWSKCPQANIALPTDNRFNSLIVLDIDIDGELNGSDSLRKITEQTGISLPDTAVSSSGSGGLHMYFRNPGKRIVRSFENKKVGIDVLSEGAHVVAPPSIHACGKAYRWIKGDILSIADADASVFRLIDILNS